MYIFLIYIYSYKISSTDRESQDIHIGTKSDDILRYRFEKIICDRRDLSRFSHLARCHGDERHPWKKKTKKNSDLYIVEISIFLNLFYLIKQLKILIENSKVTYN